MYPDGVTASRNVYPTSSHLMQCVQDGLSVVSEARVAGEDLQGRHKRRKNKEERMKSVLEGMRVQHLD